MFVITDSDAKDKFLLEDVKDLIVTKRVQVNFILTGTCEGTVDPTYTQIADFSLGLVVQVDKNEFASVMMPFIESAIDHHQRHALLAVNRVPLPESTRFVFDVIDNTTVTEIYLSGLSPSALVYPDGSSTPLPFSTSTESSMFKILTLKNIMFKSYQLEVRSAGPTSIRIHGYAENGLLGPGGTMGDLDIAVSFDFNGRLFSQPPQGKVCVVRHICLWLLLSM